MKKFIVYIPFGVPDINTTIQLLKSFNNLPVDGVEIGVPFSDPVADGPVIQKAHNIALKNKVNLELILSFILNLSLNYELYLMSYLNPVLNFPYGKKKLIELLKKCKIKGLILPDLPVEEIEKIHLNYPLVLFTAPNTTEREIELINKYNPPFVYYIARYGVTGVKKDIPFLSHIKMIKQKIKSPLYVGFGISTPQQIKQLFKIVDGVIVGSFLVKTLIEIDKKKIVSEIKKKILFLTSF